MLADEVVVVASISRLVAGRCAWNLDLGDHALIHKGLQGAIHRRQSQPRTVPTRPLVNFLCRQRLTRLAQNVQNHCPLSCGIAHVHVPLD